MARYYDIDKIKEMIEAKADTLIEGKEAFLYVAGWLNLLPTADVVPREEVERLNGELIVERTRRKNAVNAYHSAKQEVARVIFEDLESICLMHVDRYNRYLIYSEDFAELKKKYMEESAE